VRSADGAPVGELGDGPRAASPRAREEPGVGRAARAWGGGTAGGSAPRSRRRTGVTSRSRYGSHVPSVGEVPAAREPPDGGPASVDPVPEAGREPAGRDPPCGAPARRDPPCGLPAPR